MGIGKLFEQMAWKALEMHILYLLIFVNEKRVMAFNTLYTAEWYQNSYMVVYKCIDTRTNTCMQVTKINKTCAIHLYVNSRRVLPLNRKEVQ